MDILIVEDDRSVARFLSQALSEAGYCVCTEGEGNAALQKACSESFDLMVLDLMLPGMDGITICREMRTRSMDVPILIITARDTLEDKIRCLDSGADDYIVKPFQLGELLARLRALLRRYKASLTVLHLGDLTLDPQTRRATRAHKAVTLSSTEYTLLEYLMRHPGRVLSRAMILEHVWQYDFNGNDNVLDVYISYLRGKIDRGFPSPLIHTVRGVGYRLEAENEAS